MVEIRFSNSCTDSQVQELVEMNWTNSSAHTANPEFIENAEGKVVGVRIDPYFASAYRDWATDIDLAEEV